MRRAHITGTSSRCREDADADIAILKQSKARVRKAGATRRDGSENSSDAFRTGSFQPVTPNTEPNWTSPESLLRPFHVERLRSKQ
jgi:hypothetical protein